MPSQGGHGQGLRPRSPFVAQGGTLVSTEKADAQVPESREQEEVSQVRGCEVAVQLCPCPWPCFQLLPLDADALILVALSGYHHVSLIQNKHLDLLGVNELEFGAPVQDSPWGANDNLLTDLLPSFHCGDKMNSCCKVLVIKFTHNITEIVDPVKPTILVFFVIM